MSAWPGRLITDQMAMRWHYRQELQPTAARLATLYWWGTYELEDAQAELRLALLRLTGLPRMPKAARPFADDVLDQAIDQVRAQLDGCRLELERAAAHARLAGAWPRDVLAAVVAAARQMEPRPPAWMVEEAAEPPRPALRARQRPKPITEGVRLHA